MADSKKPNIQVFRMDYRTNGAAAYDVNGYNAATGPAYELVPAHRPRRKPKAKLMIAPVSILGLLAAACMLVFVICGYVQLFEASDSVSELRSQLSEAQELQHRLQSDYNSKIDLEMIQQRATSLGMTVPNSKQTVYLNLAGTDRAVIGDSRHDSFVRSMWNTITHSLHTFGEYFG